VEGVEGGALFKLAIPGPYQVSLHPILVKLTYSKRAAGKKHLTAADNSAYKYQSHKLCQRRVITCGPPARFTDHITRPSNRNYRLTEEKYS
jgi:hypothetical protein